MKTTTTMKNASRKSSSKKPSIESAFNKLQSQLAALDERDFRQAEPEPLLRHIAVTLFEKSAWCLERAACAFDIGCQEDFLNWKTLSGELDALEDLIREHIDEA